MSVSEALLGRQILTAPSPLILTMASAVIGLVAFLTALAPQYLARNGSGPLHLRAGSNLTGTRAHHTTAGTVQVLQLSLTMFVLVAAGLLGLSYGRLTAVDPAFRADRMLVMSVRPPMYLYPTAKSRGLLAARVRDRLSAESGITDVAFSSGTPFDWSAVTSVDTDSAGTNRELMWLTQISSRYFRASGIPVYAGRDFEQSEDSLFGDSGS